MAAEAIGLSETELVAKSVPRRRSKSVRLRVENGSASVSDLVIDRVVWPTAAATQPGSECQFAGERSAGRGQLFLGWIGGVVGDLDSTLETLVGLPRHRCDNRLTALAVRAVRFPIRTLAVRHPMWLV